MVLVICTRARHPQERCARYCARVCGSGTAVRDLLSGTTIAKFCLQKHRVGCLKRHCNRTTVSTYVDTVLLSDAGGTATRDCSDLVCLQTRSLMDQNNCVDICQPSGHLKLEEQPRWTVLGLVCLQNETSYGSERLCRHTSMSTQRCHLKLQGTATLDCSRPRLLTKRGRLFLICVSQPHCTVRAHK